MTQQQKEKLEQAAQKWLATKEDVMSKIRLLHETENRWDSKVKDLESRLTKYREALERAYKDFKSSRWTEETYKIVIEALKQQDNE
jgi:hypothetical protein